MKRILLYVHFNKYHKVSDHVYYQLEQMRALFSKIVFISNSDIHQEDLEQLEQRHLMDQFIQRHNKGYDFAAWHDGMKALGCEHLVDFDSITIMNDTCFGPLWDMEPYYLKYEADEAVDFWGMTNNRATKAFKEHIQSYFISFKKSLVHSKEFRQFWENIIELTDVQDVIHNYETRITTAFVEAGFRYKTVFDTTKEDSSSMLHADFSYYNPTAILKHHVPFIKVKAIDANQHIAPYLLDFIDQKTSYPASLIVDHMSQVHLPDAKYLLAHKYLSNQPISIAPSKKIAVHLHVFYADLLSEFLEAFSHFHFDYDLLITTDSKAKKAEIKEILRESGASADILVTGNIGRDVLPMLTLKERLSQYDYIGHFHTKKSKEADFWAGQSWRTELIDMMVKPADQILTTLAADAIGIVIADIPSFFRFNKIVDAWNEHLIAPEMNQLWQAMGLTKRIDFQTMDTFVMSYGTFVWFKYDALKPLFDLDLSEADIPAEPLPQNSILHAIERLLIYIAWDRHYDFRISRNEKLLTPFIDNKLLNLREGSVPHTYVDFDYMGGIKGALKYIVIGPAKAIRYIIKRLLKRRV
ncbi:TPA: alpha-L-Rha alpha-1,3-L-rhamnosyltransferase [Streptococcus equi subsp. zooepidemicus]|uniref:rhamnan synthesis F family protein n=1 Tax=Streptococcus equi TaxID=1336 RepID=UPI0013F66785|nr:rhamnan synthesis F family protein [Streptococcus equi]HEL1016682.1 alpha-L-Rha alpha-1,3-L-rhamnosyltransferase [Streptococcus equi subsp. ruminatorum]MCD3381740.1 rhamnan synthesis F family protein [Streptococcus equi subsp. zooepidemicus]MCD3420369.1 rhamnan synthesis F family protein [Streptococcus equi subsp. zooepidemicus]MCD3425332.1 rhamnan synthesis F family protein [Streptococcus equi subsp. zooepidemicus]MDI6001815.1 rhamnan synthesis F family protein [Streptococcus equi subsp. z